MPERQKSNYDEFFNSVSYCCCVILWRLAASENENPPTRHSTDQPEGKWPNDFSFLSTDIIFFFAFKPSRSVSKLKCSKASSSRRLLHVALKTVHKNVMKILINSSKWFFLSRDYLGYTHTHIYTQAKRMCGRCDNRKWQQSAVWSGKR